MRKSINQYAAQETRCNTKVDEATKISTGKIFSLINLSSNHLGTRLGSARAGSNLEKSARFRRLMWTHDRNVAWTWTFISDSAAPKNNLLGLNCATSNNKEGHKNYCLALYSPGQHRQVRRSWVYGQPKANTWHTQVIFSNDVRFAWKNYESEQR